MSSTALTTEQQPQSDNRRLHLRHKVGQLAYVACGSDNGGILIDLSEGGLGFQGVGALEPGSLCDLKLMLPAATHPLEVPGEVVWLNSSGKGGGLRFVNLPDGARRQLVEWIAAAGQADTRSSRCAPRAVPEPGGTEAQPAPAASRSIIAWEKAPPASPAEKGAEMPGDGADGSETPGTRPLGEKTPFLDSLRMAGGPTDLPARNFQPAANRPEIAPQDVMQQREPEIEAEIEEPTPVPPLPALPSVVPPNLNSKANVGARAHQSVLSDPHKGGSGAFKFVLSAALGSAVVLAAIFGMRAARSVSMAAGWSATASPVEHPDSPPQKAFQVQVTGGGNQPWTLTMGAGGSAPAESGQSAASSPASLPSVPSPAQPRVKGPADAPAKEAPVNVASSRLALPQWAFRPSWPTWPQKHATHAGDLHAPAVAEAALPAGTSLDLQEVSAGVAAGMAPPAPPRPTESRFQQAVLVHRVAPVYSPLALQQRIEGGVEVNITVGKDGVPKALQVLKGDPRLAGAAVTAIRRWRYHPALLNGKPVETQTNVEVQFHLRP